MKKIILMTMSMISFNVLAGGAPPYITVGGDNACDFSEIQDAILNGASDTIRIASNKNYFESLEISNGNEKLIGGYADCTQAAQNITDLSQAIVTGNGSDPVIEVIHTIGIDYEVKIQNMLVANGSSGIYITTQNSASSLTQLINVKSINNNRGLHVFSFNAGDPSVDVKDSSFGFNEQGIYCTGTGSKVRIGGESVVENNQSVGDGTGIAISNGCDVDIYSPTIIKNNAADGSGGAVHVTDAAVNVIGAGPFCENNICMGTYDSPVLIENNTADADNNNFGSGGGIYIGVSAEASIINAYFKENQARQGGAMYATNGSNVTAIGYESPGNPCWSPGACLQFEGNSAVWGGALYAINEDTSVLVSAAKFTEQTATAGAIAHVRNDASMGIKDSFLFNNGLGGLGVHADDDLFEIFDVTMALETVLTLDGITIADNDLTGQIIENFGGKLDLFSSLLFGQVDVYAESGDSPQSHIECVIAHEDDSFTAGGTVSVVDRLLQPVFVNPLGGNYHLRVDSPAIDYCYDASGNASTDIDYDDRGIDNPDVDNLHGVFDIGADEFNIENDIIFKDGFELD